MNELKQTKHVLFQIRNQTLGYFIETDTDGNQIQSKTEMNKLKMTGAIISKIRNTSFDYFVFHSDGWMCKITRSILNDLVDYDVDDYYFRPIFCLPSNMILGCPQDFCISSAIDDFVEHNSNQLLFRGQYYWESKNKNIPLTFPLFANANSIRYMAIYADFPDYIDAGFSFKIPHSTSVLTYIFVDDEVFIFQDEKRKKIRKIRNQFRGVNVKYVDAAMFYKSRIFLFRNEQIYLFSLKLTNRIPTFSFKGNSSFFFSNNTQFQETPNIDAILQIEDKIFMTRGYFYYEINLDKWYEKSHRTSPINIINNLLEDKCAESNFVYKKVKDFLRNFKPSRLNLEFHLKDSEFILNTNTDISNFHWYIVVAATLGFLILSIVIVVIILEFRKKSKENNEQMEMKSERSLSTTSFSKNLMSVNYKDSKKIFVSHFKDKKLFKKH